MLTCADNCVDSTTVPVECWSCATVLARVPVLSARTGATAEEVFLDAALAADGDVQTKESHA
ncbi:MAG: hypothetical protein JWL62_3857 [Hyphomicrobiales bacterium]|nr:hypothetical protein [Hyphomicrobiales bacterium]